MLRGLRSCLRQVGSRVYPASFSTSEMPLCGPEDEKELMFEATEESAIAYIIREHQVYVDNTAWIYRLLTSGMRKMYYCGPKRLGKSTPLRLIEDLCKDQAENLFKGTEIARTDFFTKHWIKNGGKSDYPYTCIRFNFYALPTDNPGALQNMLLYEIQRAAQRHGIKVPHQAGLDILIDSLSLKKKKQVVMLVDDVDKPYNNTDPKFRDQYKEIINDFFAPTKLRDDIRLLLLTGTVNRLSEMGDANTDTVDITNHPTLHPALGFTEQQVKKLFPCIFLNQFGITGETDQTAFHTELKRHYGGYVLGEQSNSPVYEPFSVLRCRRNSCHIQQYWSNVYFMKELYPFVSLLPSHINEKTAIEISRFEAKAEDSEFSKERNKALRTLWNYGILTAKSSTENTHTLMATNQDSICKYHTFLKEANEQLFGAFHIHAKVANLVGLKKELLNLLKPGYRFWTTEAEIEQFLFTGFKKQRMCVDLEDLCKTGRVDSGNTDFVVTYPDVSYVLKVTLNRTVKEAMDQIRSRQLCEELPLVNRQVFLVALNYDTGHGLNIQIAEMKKVGGKFEYVNRAQ